MNTTEQIDFGLSPEVIELLEGLFTAREKVKKVLVFGSRAKGNYNSGSDIDLALITDDFSHDDMMELLLAIDDLDLLYKVDCLDYHKIDSAALKAHIDRVGLPIYTSAK